MRISGSSLLLAIVIPVVSSSAQRPTTTDSAGIRILDYRAMTAARRIVSGEPVASVGAQGTGPAELLDGVIGAARLSDGRLVIAQSKVMGRQCGAGGCTLRGGLLAAIYDSTGKPQSIFGRMGQGPGELSQAIVALHVIDGDTIVLAEQRGRMIFYDRSGRYLSAFKPVDPNLRGSPMPIGFASNGDMVGVMHVNAYNGVAASTIPEGNVTYHDTLVIEQFDRAGLPTRTIARMFGDSVSFTHTITKTSDGVRYTVQSPPKRGLLPSLCWTTSICKGTGNENDVGVYVGGRLTQILRFPPPAAAERSSAHLPIVQGPRGELWIHTTSNGVSRWWIVAQDGRLVATCELGKARLFQVGPDFVVLVRTDVDGVEVVEVRRTTLR